MEMIEYNILDVEGPSVICHQVNCLGIMGGGLALQIRNKWQEVYESYTAKKDWRLGDCQIVEIGMDSRFVANLAGQQNIGSGNQTSIISLARALRVARDFANANHLTLYIPYMMGCGLAGGDWNLVSKMIEQVAPNAIICKLPE